MPNKKMFVMVGGYKGAGKDTVTDEVMRMIRENHPRVHVSKEMISKPIKEIASKYFKWNGEKDDAGRALLQVIGDALRNIPDMTVSQMVENVRERDKSFSWDDAIYLLRQAEHLGNTFDPLMAALENRVNDNYPTQIVFVTDTRMLFEFSWFNPNMNMCVWIHSDWASPSNHITESIDPETIPGVYRILNVRDSDLAMRMMYQNVMEKANATGLLI